MPVRFLSQGFLRRVAFPTPQRSVWYTTGSNYFSMRYSWIFENLSLKWLCEHAGGGCNVTCPNPPPNSLADWPRAHQYTPAQPTSRRGVGKKSDRRHLLQSPHFFYFFGSRSTLFSFSLSFCDADLTSCVKKSHQNLQPESRNSRMSTFFPSLSVTPVSLTLVDPEWNPCSWPDTGQHQLQGGYLESLLETLREAVTVLYKYVQQWAQ